MDFPVHRQFKEGLREISLCVAWWAWWGSGGGGNEGKLQGIYWMRMLLFILFFWFLRRLKVAWSIILKIWYWLYIESCGMWLLMVVWVFIWKFIYILSLQSFLYMQTCNVCIANAGKQLSSLYWYIVYIFWKPGITCWYLPITLLCVSPIFLEWTCSFNCYQLEMILLCLLCLVCRKKA